MTSERKQVDRRPGPADELDWVRWRLARMVEQRLVVPLSPAEQELYRELLRRERALLATVVDTGGGRGPNSGRSVLHSAS